MLTRKRRNRHFCTKSYPVKIFNSTLRKYPTLELYIFQFHLLRRPPCCPPSRPTTAPSPMLPYWLRPPWHRRHPWLPSPPDAAPSFPLLCWTFSGHRKWGRDEWRNERVKGTEETGWKRGLKEGNKSNIRVKIFLYSSHACFNWAGNKELSDLFINSDDLHDQLYTYTDPLHLNIHGGAPSTI